MEKGKRAVNMSVKVIKNHTINYLPKIAVIFICKYYIDILDIDTLKNHNTSHRQLPLE